VLDCPNSGSDVFAAKNKIQIDLTFLVELQVELNGKRNRETISNFYVACERAKIFIYIFFKCLYT